MSLGSKSTRILLTLAALCIVGACGKSSKEAQPKGDEAGKVTTGAGVAQDSEAPQAEIVKSTAPEGPTGSIKGIVSIKGETPEMPLLRRGSDPACDKGEMRAETILVGEGGLLANVLVRIKPNTVPAWTPSGTVKVDQTNCMYRPRVQGGVRGQTVEITNADATTHNVHARRLPLGRRQGVETLMNRAQPAGVSMTFELGDEPVAKLKCDYHGWMQGYIVVSDNPYFAVSSKTGAYEMQGVPTGTHTIEMWHEYYGLKTASVTIEDGAVASLDYSYDALADDPMKSKSPVKAEAGKVKR
jgi:plastocyanin